MIFATVEITTQTIDRTREHFAELGRQCIADAKSGATYVNDLPSYVIWQRANIKRFLAGDFDHTFTFLQRAHWLQTGECLPFFSRKA